MLIEIISVHEHDPTTSLIGLLVFATCSFISVKMRQFIQKPEIQKGWNAFILLTIATTFIHFLTILFWLINNEAWFDLMEEVVHYIGSVAVLLLFTGLFFVQRELWRSFDKIGEAFKVKSAFMHSMSHEMRTPLNAIIGYADMLDQGLQGSLTGEQASSVKAILTSSNDLLKMTEAILENASVTAEHFDIRTFVVKEKSSDCFKSIINSMCDKLRETGHAEFVNELMGTVPADIKNGLRGC